MKRLLQGLVLGNIVTVMVACGGTDDNTGAEETTQSLVPVEVTFNIDEQAEPGDTLTFEVEVTQGDEQVDDAHEVTFEVWQPNHKEHSEMIEATNEEEGKYIASYTFEEESLYYVQAHVTARDTHVMPRMEVLVGDPDLSAIEDEELQTEMDHDNQNEENDHSH
ncbi:FixH family protein [Jeotgalibacillus soli]|uniref:YtkA-like domain-containing protein n=1 Tax=Jeotgalibacillus soli TaxID=889306 RepID=A0A0C2V9J0_9BACL|nr:FixH family protein [Jeotgalibacillus soli]KIL45617.1 hypothetical protein KP78_19660 [Jeotgalibacillus soli]